MAAPPGAPARPPAPRWTAALAELAAGAPPRLAQALRAMWRDLAIPDGDADGALHASASASASASAAHVRGCCVLAVLQHRPGAPRPLPPPLCAVPPTLTVVYEVDPARMWTRSLGEMAQALRSPHEVRTRPGACRPASAVRQLSPAPR